MRDVTAFRPRELRVSTRVRGTVPTGTEVSLGYAKTPFGACTLGVCGDAIAWLSFGEASVAEVGARVGCAVRDDDARAVGRIAARLFEPPRHGVAILLVGTPFQLRAWCTLLDVPFGATTTYGALAASLEQPGAARAVGTAVGANPVAVLVPCHRVVGAAGALGGYRWGLATKRALLAAERPGA
jgi:AraC family transcriptional regulator of adaptative response/methylated-DNA-[protein]-cysteine methyltransferase